MTERLQVYKCLICGNIVEVLHVGKGELVCCGRPMKLLEENTEDASKEKHVPVVKKYGEKVTVKIGSAPHPMEEKHYIEWAEVIAGEKISRKFLSPNNTPEVVFDCTGDEQDITVRIYCNLHGLWKA
ncbi:MAG: desulfoferrodoxin [Firmicutes bacterium]|nr:desulfoferrodoxin [Bacillota bacterium]